MLTLHTLVQHPDCRANKHPHYLDFYEEVFTSQDVRYLLEVGTKQGLSLNLFATRLPEAQIFGMDIRKPTVHLRRNVHFVKCDASCLSDSWLDQVLPRGGLDFIIDDASHKRRQTEATFRTLFPRLKHQGVYVIEDFGAYTQSPCVFDDGSDAYCANNVGFVKSFVSDLAVWTGHKQRTMQNTVIAKMVLLPNLCAIWKR